MKGWISRGPLAGNNMVRSSILTIFCLMDSATRADVAQKSMMAAACRPTRCANGITALARKGGESPISSNRTSAYPPWTSATKTSRSPSQLPASWRASDTDAEPEIRSGKCRWRRRKQRDALLQKSTIEPPNSMLATLPDALADALGRVVSDVRREARAEIETIKALYRAEMAELRERTSETITQLKATSMQRYLRRRCDLPREGWQRW